MERFSRAEVYLTYEAIWWSHPRSSEHYAMPLAIGRDTSARDAVAVFRGLGFSG